MKITLQGKVLISKNERPYEIKKRKVVVLDLISKYSEISATGSNNGNPEILLCENKNTLHIGESKNDFTIIELPEYKGWTILCAEIRKYTLAVALIKE